MKQAKRIYGPVPSRRFGLSLGVDLVPHKICTYDCIYCQLGRTAEKSIRRREFYPLDSIVTELQDALASGPMPDVVTLAGSGEPTLYAPLGHLIASIKEMTDIPIVLLTGGGSLFRDDVAEDVQRVDVLAPSLDAGNENCFQTVNRPHPSISFELMRDGLKGVLENFSGDVRLEVMLVRDVNDSGETIEDLVDLISRLNPTHVDLNTPVRPGASSRARPCTQAFLGETARRIGPTAEAIASFHEDSGKHLSSQATDVEQSILSTLSRRPCTIKDLADSTGLHPTEITKLIDTLLHQGLVTERHGKGSPYFWAPPEGSP